MPIDNRGYRVLSTLLKSGGGLLSDYAAGKQAERRAFQKGERLRDLFSNVPELAGFESAFDPSTGEIDDIALELIKERGRAKRSEDSSRNIADRMFAQAQLQDQFARRREREKRAARLEDNPAELEELLIGRGLPGSEELAGMGISADDLLQRVRQGKRLPSGIPTETTPLHEKFFNLFKDDEDDVQTFDYDIIDPEGVYDQLVP